MPNDPRADGFARPMQIDNDTAVTRYAEGDSSRGVTVVIPPPSIVNDGPGRRVAHTEPSPPRPAMSGGSIPPIVPETPYTRTVQTVRALWLLSFAFGTAAALFAAFSAKGRLTALREYIPTLRSGYDEATISTAASILFWSVTAMCVALIVVQALVLVRLLRGRFRPRWWLLVLVAAQCVLVVLVHRLVAVDRDGLLITLLALAQLTIALIAAIGGVCPGTKRWLVTRRETEDAARSGRMRLDQ
ncbi:hypothetical protein [Cumulibacter soli]|uniref:hypothetical protein n=1 Tax=Cumulibacter soli TaxID=2546344 RepID=UPI0010686E77|nr:hypothetical protein [Cumulibacter soli]